jgi:hypothetical protein
VPDEPEEHRGDGEVGANGGGRVLKRHAAAISFDNERRHSLLPEERVLEDESFWIRASRSSP